MKKIGRYDVLKELGRGAMGVVYAAEDSLIGRTVAIKTIRFGTPEAGEDRAQLVQRLHREAQAAGVLSHSGIVTVYDVGEQEDEAYIVMEFVDGKSVEDLLASDEQRHPGAYLPILRGTAAAIDYAHGKGIIHRDVKPSNIMVCRDGTVKIADFGIAKLTASNSLTQAGFVVGTPSYMSPEQAQGRAVDGRSDQFSLAVVAFRMITGILPFEGPTLTALLTKILWDEPEYENAGMSPAIRPVFKRALSKDPQLRFPTCSDFVRGLEDAVAGSDPSLIVGFPPAAQQGATSANLNAALRGSGTAAERAFEASRFGQGSIPQAAPWTTPTPDSAAFGGMAQNAQSQAAVPASVERVRKRKLLFIVGAAILGCLAIVLAVIFAFKVAEKPSAPVQNGSMAAVPAPKEGAGVLPSTETTPVPQPSPVGSDPPGNATAQGPAQGAIALPGAGNKESAQANAEQRPDRKAVKTSPISVQPVPSSDPKTASPEDSAFGAKREEVSTTPQQSNSGVLSWSGELERNSILVISEQRSSIGNIVGQLPGKPVKITVEPKGLTIRQAPGEANRWNQIILYSGNQRYTSITIHWSIAE